MRAQNRRNRTDTGARPASSGIDTPYKRFIVWSQQRNLFLSQSLSRVLARTHRDTQKLISTRNRFGRSSVETNSRPFGLKIDTTKVFRCKSHENTRGMNASVLRVERFKANERCEELWGAYPEEQVEEEEQVLDAIVDGHVSLRCCLAALLAARWSPVNLWRRFAHAGRRTSPATPTPEAHFLPVPAHLELPRDWLGSPLSTTSSRHLWLQRKPFVLDRSRDAGDSRTSLVETGGGWNAKGGEGCSGND